MRTNTEITPETTVSRLLELAPESVAILDELGIDTCCGGSLSLEEAAAEADTSLQVLLETLLAKAAGR